MNNDEKYMNRCIELARNGLGNVAPNPLVGCVIVHNDKIIGEGYHKFFGGPHAEVNAIHSVKNKSLLPESTIYVNLEPCTHFGKTPPCSDLIIKKEIPKVVIGTEDPYVEVSGNGIKKLKNAGCDVKTGVLQKNCKDLNKRFFTFINKKRPYIILKWAQTKNGLIDIIRDHNSPQQPTWITNETSRNLVHKWRNEEQAIMIGRVTAEMDNPKLTNRNWGTNSPIRIVMDNELVLEKNLNMFDQSIETIIFNRKISKKDKNLEYIQFGNQNNEVAEVLDYLYNRKIQSVIIEGGEKLLSTFITDNAWDEARVFVGDKSFKEGVRAPTIIGEPVYSERLIASYLYIYKAL